jgi:hypothetical protein
MERKPSLVDTGSGWGGGGPMPPLPDHVGWGRGQGSHVREILTFPGDASTSAHWANSEGSRQNTLVDNIFTTPLPDELVEQLGAQRAGRLDYSPIDTG